MNQFELSTECENCQNPAYRTKNHFTKFVAKRPPFQLKFCTSSKFDRRNQTGSVIAGNLNPLFHVTYLERKYVISDYISKMFIQGWIIVFSDGELCKICNIFLDIN